MLLLLSVSTSSLVASKESSQRTGHQKSPRRRIETRTQQPLSSNCSRPHLRKRFFASSHAALVAASQHCDLSSLDRGPSRSNGSSETQAATSPSATCRNRQMFGRPIGSPLACGRCYRGGSGAQRRRSGCVDARRGLRRSVN